MSDELFTLGIGAAGLAGLATPALIYRWMRKRYAHIWPEIHRRVLSPTGGAYRGGVVTLVTPGEPTTAMKIATLSSLYMGLAWIPSAPIALLGMAIDSDEHVLGAATLFGPTGVALSIALFIVALQLGRGRGRRGAGVVGVWAFAHNLAVLGAVFLASSGYGAQNPHSSSWEVFNIVNGGWISILYAFGSIAHAVLLMVASRDVGRIERLKLAREEADDSGQFAALPLSPA